MKAMKMDGYDDCIIGVAERFGMGRVIAYDTNKIIKKLMKDGMSRGEAEEWFYYNQIGSWVGEGTPVFVELMDRKLVEDRL